MSILCALQVVWVWLRWLLWQDCLGVDMHCRQLVFGCQSCMNIHRRVPGHTMCCWMCASVSPMPIATAQHRHQGLVAILSTSLPHPPGCATMSDATHFHLTSVEADQVDAKEVLWRDQMPLHCLSPLFCLLCHYSAVHDMRIQACEENTGDRGHNITCAAHRTQE